MKDEQDIFDGEVHQTTEGVSPEAPESQPRDESGRFAAKDKGEAAPAAEGAPPAPTERQSRDVPITALLDEREKRQRAEAALEALRRQQPQQQPQMPDPVEDAAGYTQAVYQQIEQMRQSDRLAMSQFLAEDKYGKALVDEAMAFFDTQPRHVSAQFLTERSPFHAAVAWFQNHKAMQERTAPDFEQKLREKIEAELREKIAAEMGSPPSPRVPRSLADAPGSGNHVPPVQSSDPLFS